MNELILAVDDNRDSLFTLEQVLLLNGYRVNTAADGEDALRQAMSEPPAVILLDVVMPYLNGYEVTKRLKSDPNLRFVPVILLTAKDTLDDIVTGLERGADGYITKPFNSDELVARLRAALRLRALYQELRTTKLQNSNLLAQLSSGFSFDDIIGSSSAMREVLGLVAKLVNVDSPVLVTGPSGTGKELIARAIHFNSPRRSNPFVAVNCAALNEHLLESELFGHTRGAFTGAFRDKAGLFEAADGGTLFLDEIGELPLALQAKLLRVLQDGRFIPVGSTSEREVDVRIVAATNRDLRLMSDRGQFREDLYYRLNVINLVLPPLTARRDDIPVLAEHFLRKAQIRTGTEKRFSAEAIEMLSAYEWRGNVRELQNEIERMLILGQDRTELGADLLSSRISEAFRITHAQTEEASESSAGSLKHAIERLERRMIAASLERCRGNRSHAAKELGISRSSLIAKIQQYGLA